MNDDWFNENDPRIVAVVITVADMLRVDRWPGMTVSNAIAIAMQNKGLKMRPSFDPKPEDLLPPWRMEQCIGTEVFAVWQLQEDRK